MAVYDFDGYEDYATAGLLREHVRLVQNNGLVEIVAGGRNGGSRLRCQQTSGTASAYACRSFGALRTTLAFGVYMQCGAVVALDLFDLRNSTDSQLVVRLNADGSISVMRFTSYTGNDYGNHGSSVLLGTTNPGLVQVDVPFHFQMKALINNAAGTAEIKMNGTTVLNLTGIDTYSAGDVGVTHLLMGVKGLATTSSFYFDDYWAADSFLGDCVVHSHYPVSDGTNGDGTPSGGGDSYDEVDENGEPNDDTDYVTLAAAGDRDTFSVEAFKNDGADIKAVMVVLDTKKNDAGAGTIAGSIYKSGADYDGGEDGITTSYNRTKDIWELDPSDAAAWTAAKFDASEFGYTKVV